MTCRRCGSEAEEAGSLAWYALPWFLLFGALPRTRDLCRDCAGGRNVLALLASIALLAVVFVVVVIMR